MNYNLWSIDDIKCDMNKRGFMSKDEKMSIQHYLTLYEHNFHAVKNLEKKLTKSENEKKELLLNYNRLNEMYERSQDYTDYILEREKKILNERKDLIDKKQKMTDEISELYGERKNIMNKCDNLVMEKNELAYKNCLLNKENDIVGLQNVKLTNAYNDIIFQYNELREKHYDLVKICKQIKEYTEGYEEYEEDEKDKRDEKDEKDEKGIEEDKEEIEEDKEENDTRKRKINVNSIEPEQSVSKKINIYLEKK